jgi:hypothetical protein
MDSTAFDSDWMDTNHGAEISKVLIARLSWVNLIPHFQPDGFFSVAHVASRSTDIA